MANPPLFGVKRCIIVLICLTSIMTCVVLASLSDKLVDKYSQNTEEKRFNLIVFLTIVTLVALHSVFGFLGALLGHYCLTGLFVAINALLTMGLIYQSFYNQTYLSASFISMIITSISLSFLYDLDSIRLSGQFNSSLERSAISYGSLVKANHHV